MILKRSILDFSQNTNKKHRPKSQRWKCIFDGTGTFLDHQANTTFQLKSTVSTISKFSTSLRLCQQTLKPPRNYFKPKGPSIHYSINWKLYLLPKLYKKSLYKYPSQDLPNHQPIEYISIYICSPQLRHLRFS